MREREKGDWRAIFKFQSKTLVSFIANSNLKKNSNLIEIITIKLYTCFRCIFMWAEILQMICRNILQYINALVLRISKNLIKNNY